MQLGRAPQPLCCSDSSCVKERDKGVVGGVKVWDACEASCTPRIVYLAREFAAPNSECSLASSDRCYCLSRLASISPALRSSDPGQVLSLMAAWCRGPRNLCGSALCCVLSS